MEYIVIINKYTGNKYAYPASRYSELPCVTIEDDDTIGHTNFGRHDLISMESTGSAVKVGEASIKLSIKYETGHL